jgi:hypothetical protein
MKSNPRNSTSNKIKITALKIKHKIKNKTENTGFFVEKIQIADTTRSMLNK